MPNLFNHKYFLGKCKWTKLPLFQFDFVLYLLTREFQKFCKDFHLFTEVCLKMHWAIFDCMEFYDIVYCKTISLKPPFPKPYFNRGLCMYLLLLVDCCNGYMECFLARLPWSCPWNRICGSQMLFNQNTRYKPTDPCWHQRIKTPHSVVQK